MSLFLSKATVGTFGLLLIQLSGTISAASWEDNAEIKRLFADANVVGTFVVYDIAEDKLLGHSPERAKQRFYPASTFKIPNSLIGLSVGAVTDVDEVLPYGGKPQHFKSWEKDMALREAIQRSNVAIYQELARRIGLKRMTENVQTLGYGNADVGTELDRFWLNGPLKISAIEQAQFLAKLAQSALPYPKEAQAAVREIMLLERSEDWALYAKTGWAFEARIGWWVGWVEKDDKVYPFALNIDMATIEDANKRIEIGTAVLTELGIL